MTGHAAIAGKTSPPLVARRASYVRNLVVVDGIMRTGKFLHDALVSSLERCEMWQQYPIIDSIPILHGLGLMSGDVAVALLQREIDMHLYYGLVGRRSNFRYDDRSSIWHHRDPRQYFELIFSREESGILERIDEIDPIFVLSTHDVMCNAEVLFEAFPALRMVYARRHPVDIVYSWHMKDWGRRIGVEPRALWLAFEGPTGPVPWHATEWAERYENLAPMDRIIEGVDWLTARAQAALDGLAEPRREQVFVATFEWAASRPDEYLERLSTHIGSSPSDATARIMAEERVPRILSRDDFEMRRETIRREASAEAFDRIADMSERYERVSKQELDIDVVALRQ